MLTEATGDTFVEGGQLRHHAIGVVVAIAHDLQEAISEAGYVIEPQITSQLLTRRLIMSAYIESDDAGAAMAIARSVLPSQPHEHGPASRRLAIHHADPPPAR